MNHTTSNGAARLPIADKASDDLSRRRFLAGVGAAGLIGGIGGLVTGGGPSVALASGGETPYLNARDFPAIDPTGKSECSADFEEAMEQAIAANLRLYLPAGDYLFKSVILQSGLHLFGDPAFATRLIFPIDEVGSIMGTGGEGTSVDDIVFEDILWDGQQQLRKVSMGNALLKAYKAKRWTLRRCKLINGTSYGFGWQGYPSHEDPNKRGPQTDLLLEDVYLHDNGYVGGTVGQPHSGTSTSSDNIDIKSSERILMNRVYSTGSSDKGIDVRAQFGVFVNCIAEDNLWGWDLNSHHPNKEAGVTNNDSHFTVLGGGARDNIGTGVIVTATSGDSDTYADIVGVHSIGNGSNGLGTSSPPAGSAIHLNVEGGHYNDNIAHGVSAVGVSDFNCSDVTALRNQESGIYTEKSPGANISGCTVEKNKGEAGIRCKESGGGAIQGNVSNENARGIYATSHVGGAMIGNACTKSVGNGIVIDGTSDNVDATHNTLLGNGTPITMAGAKSIAHPNVTDASAIPSVASAGELTLPTTNDTILITGTTEITKIVAGKIGRRVTLTFSSSLTIKDGGNLQLAGNLSATSASVLTLVCIGANWKESGRTAV